MTTSFHSEATTPEEALRELREYLQVKASRIAVKGLVDVVQDPKANAQSRATAGSAILRAAGFFKEADDGGRKEPHEMTAEELQKEIRRLQKSAKSDDLFS